VNRDELLYKSIIWHTPRAPIISAPVSHRRPSGQRHREIPGVGLVSKRHLS
jgi:hypothetical protein